MVHSAEAAAGDVLILLSDSESAGLLAEMLGRNRRITIGESEAAVAGRFDLGVVDGPMLQRLWRRIAERKRSEAPALLPFLLVTTPHDVAVRSVPLDRGRRADPDGGPDAGAAGSSRRPAPRSGSLGAASGPFRGAFPAVLRDRSGGQVGCGSGWTNSSLQSRSGRSPRLSIGRGGVPPHLGRRDRGSGRRSRLRDAARPRRSAGRVRDGADPHGRHPHSRAAARRAAVGRGTPGRDRGLSGRRFRAAAPGAAAPHGRAVGGDRQARGRHRPQFQQHAQHDPGLLRSAHDRPADGRPAPAGGRGDSAGGAPLGRAYPAAAGVQPPAGASAQ